MSSTSTSTSPLSLEERIEKDFQTPGHPVAFSSPQVIQKYYHIGAAKAREIVAGFDSYTLHKQSRTPRLRNPFYVYFRRQQLQGDLLELGVGLAKKNDGVKYIFVIIDCYTRKAWARPMKTKQTEAAIKALSSVFDSLGPNDLPRSMTFDAGKEFQSQKMAAFLSKRSIKVILPHSDTKCPFAERFIRTLKGLIYKYMTHMHTRRFIDVLQQLMKTYNSRPHRSIAGMSPNDAELSENKEKLLDAANTRYTAILRKARKRKNRISFNIGDTVRLSRATRAFQRGYEERSTKELFTVIKINSRMPVVQYKVEAVVADKKGDKTILGSFYPDELVLVREKPSSIK